MKNLLQWLLIRGPKNVASYTDNTSVIARKSAPLKSLIPSTGSNKTTSWYFIPLILQFEPISIKKDDRLNLSRTVFNALQITKFLEARVINLLSIQLYIWSVKQTEITLGMNRDTVQMHIRVTSIHSTKTFKTNCK